MTTSSSGEATLAALFGELFATDELERFLQHGPEGEALLRSLGTQTNPADLANKAVLALKRRGLVDLALFDRLRAERPRRRNEIDAVQAACLVPVQGTGPAPTHDPTRPHFFVPFPKKGAGVVGRAAALARVRKQLVEGRRTNIGQTASFVGMGGIGKTQLAVEYCHEFRDEYPGGVYWITADQDIDSQLIRLAKEANWVHPELPPADQRDVARERVRTTPNALLVFDNAGSLGDLKEVMPRADAKLHILLTSREPQAGFQEVALELLTEDQGLELLTAESGRAELTPEEEAAARRIVQALGRLPLALEVAGAYLQSMITLGWGTYAGLVEEAVIESRAMRPAGFEATSLTGHDADLRAALRVSETLRASCALLTPVLDLLAWSGTASMGRSLLDALLEPVGVLDLEEALSLAVRLRILAIEGSGAAARYRMHRLVQQVWRLEAPLNLSRSDWVKNVAGRLGAWFEERRKEFAKLGAFQAELDHLREWRTHCEWLRLDSEAVRLLWLEAYPAYHAFRPSETLRLLNLAAAKYREVGLTDELQLAHIENDRRWALGHDDGALRSARVAYEIRERLLGPAHEDTLTALSSLVQLLGRKGDVAEALARGGDALSSAEALLGEAHNVTLGILRVLSAVERSRGRADRALAYARRMLMGSVALEWRADAEQEIAYCNFVLRQWRDALEWATRALESKATVYGPAHPTTRLAQFWRARVRWELGSKPVALREATTAIHELSVDQRADIESALLHMQRNTPGFRAPSKKSPKR